MPTAGTSAIRPASIVDATAAPWSQYYRMYSYVTRELPGLVAAELPARPGAPRNIRPFHGRAWRADVALRNPERYKSVSAFAPIAAPMQCPWGQKAFGNYLGADSQSWREYDASELVARRPFPGPMLIDQGDADQFLLAGQLLPEKFSAAAAKSGQALSLRMQPGYDHGYYFIQTFMADHLRHHAQQLNR